MKKLLKYAVGCAVAILASSCTTTLPITATSNPVGNKCGVAETKRYLTIFGGSADCGINKAAKNGGITRISHVDQYKKDYFFVTVIGVRVYGE